MKPELLLSVDSKQRFWLDPRNKAVYVSNIQHRND